MNSPPEHLLQPSLASTNAKRAPYSTTAHVVTSFFGGPFAALGMSAVNAWRLGRLGRDLGWIVALAVGYLSLRWWLAGTPGGVAAMEQLGQLLGSGAASALRRGLGLACFLVAMAVHRREQSATDLMDLKRPSGLLIGLLMFAVGRGLDTLLDRALS